MKENVKSKFNLASNQGKCNTFTQKTFIKTCKIK